MALFRTNGKTMEMIIKRRLKVGTSQAAGFSDGAVFNAGLSACLKKAQFLIIEHDKFGTSRVSSLLTSSAPSTILFEIAKRVIDSFNLMINRAFSHISQKLCKVTPFFTDRYPATTVMPECFTVWIRRSVDHALPAYVFRASSGASAVAMLSRLKSQATAGLSLAARQLGGWYDGTIATRALTQPGHSTPMVLSTRENRQQPEYLPSQVNRSLPQALVTDTATGFSVSASQVSCLHRCKAATFTRAFPSRLTRRGVLRSSYSRESPKFTACQVESFHYSIIPHMAKGVQHWPS